MQTDAQFEATIAEGLRQEKELAAANEALYGPLPAPADFKWCECGPHDFDEDAYYRRENGSHGWWHAAKCRGLVQAG